MNTRVLSIGSALLAATAGLAISAPKAEALSFALRFDNSFDGTVAPPFVGTGTFSFDGVLPTLPDGSRGSALSSLLNLDFSINFGGSIFDENDIVELDGAFVSLQGQEASFQNLFFENELNQSLQFLALGADPNVYIGLGADPDTFLAGDYSATQVPTPALLPGLIGMGIGIVRKRRAEQAVPQAVKQEV